MSHHTQTTLTTLTTLTTTLTEHHATTLSPTLHHTTTPSAKSHNTTQDKIYRTRRIVTSGQCFHCISIFYSQYRFPEIKFTRQRIITAISNPSKSCCKARYENTNICVINFLFLRKHFFCLNNRERFYSC